MKYIIKFQDRIKCHWITMPKTWTIEEAERRVTYYKYLSPVSKFKIEVIK